MSVEKINSGDSGMSSESSSSEAGTGAPFLSGCYMHTDDSDDVGAPSGGS